MMGSEIDRLIQLLSRLPGLGPRSARRIALCLIEKKETQLIPLANALQDAAEKVLICPQCGNYDTFSPCCICSDESRDSSLLCVVEDVAGLWALERTGVFRGHYHVLGGLLSALDGITPEDLGLHRLLERVESGRIKEVILATPATVEGQTTAHYVADSLEKTGISVSGLAQGVPLGGSLGTLDDGTITAAVRQRRLL